MHLGPRGFVLLAASLLAFNAGVAPAQTPQDYQPRMGQKGKDVVWIPSPEDMVEKMLDMAKVTPADFVIDLGSGDGRNVIAAARRGAQALGVEYNADLVELSRRNAANAGLADRASFVQGDMYKADISGASALILFLIPDNLAKLAPRFLELKPGTRIVSNTYEIGGGWEADETDRTDLCAAWCVAHLYIVPAKVAGTWRMPHGHLTVHQSFQQVYGTYDIDGISIPIEAGWLRGNDVRFTINSVEYTGRVEGNMIAGTAKGRTVGPWKATRVD